MCRLEIDQPARGRRANFRFGVLFSQAVELGLQNFSHAILKARSLACEPVIERGRDPVEIFEETFAIRLDEVAGVRGRVGARIEDRERVDPALPDIDADAVATDFDKARNVSINDAVELRKRLTQAHPGLGVSRAVPQQADKAASRDALALREAQTGQ